LVTYRDSLAPSPIQTLTWAAYMATSLIDTNELATNYKPVCRPQLNASRSTRPKRRRLINIHKHDLRRKRDSLKRPKTKRI